MLLGTAEYYITKPAPSRGEEILHSLLTALGASDDDRAEALRLHRRLKHMNTVCDNSVITRVLVVQRKSDGSDYSAIRVTVERNQWTTSCSR